MARPQKQPKYTAQPRIEKQLGVWEDSTSYSQRDPYPRVPRGWRLRLTRDVQIYVGSDHIYHPGEWIVTCAPWFDVLKMNLTVTQDNAPDAQRLALDLVRTKINELAAAIAATTV